jgi:hypothetical protein
MSIAAFQSALAEMAGRPPFAARVRHEGGSALTGYDLTLRESRRLVAVARQPGMEITCTLARANRFTSIAEVFPMTCHVLGSDLRSLIDRYFGARVPDNYQLSGEEEAFANFLQDEMAAGRVALRFVADILAFETASYRLALAGRDADNKIGTIPPDETVIFSQDPGPLLDAVGAGLAPPDLPLGHYPVRLSLEGGAIRATHMR